MLRLTFVIGGILSVLGVVSYLATAAVSVTALIPTFVGLLLLGCAALAAAKPATRRHAIHAALVVALLGALGSLMQVVKLPQLLAGTAARPAAVAVGTAMCLLLVLYIALGVRSFIAARRARA